MNEALTSAQCGNDTLRKYWQVVKIETICLRFALKDYLFDNTCYEINMLAATESDCVSEFGGE